MVAAWPARSVTPVVCATPLEARVRELRLIAEHEPPYNRRSRLPDAARGSSSPTSRSRGCPWSASVRADGAAYLGPFGSARQASLGRGRAARGAPAAAVHRPDAQRAAPRPGPACWPRSAGAERRASAGRPSTTTPAWSTLARRAIRADAGRRWSTALLGPGRWPRRSRAVRGGRRPPRPAGSPFLRGAARTQRLAPLASAAELVAARRSADSAAAWELVAGPARPAGRHHAQPARAPTRARIEALRSTGEQVVARPPAPLPAAPPGGDRAVLRLAGARRGAAWSSWTASGAVRRVAPRRTWLGSNHPDVDLSRARRRRARQGEPSSRLRRGSRSPIGPGRRPRGRRPGPHRPRRAPRSSRRRAGPPRRCRPPRPARPPR